MNRRQALKIVRRNLRRWQPIVTRPFRRPYTIPVGTWMRVQRYMERRNLAYDGGGFCRLRKEKQREHTK